MKKIFVYFFFILLPALLSGQSVMSVKINGTINPASADFIRTDSTLEFARISYSVIVTTTIVTALFFLFIICIGLKAQRAKPVTGIEGLIGETGETLVILDLTGTVRVHGEVWNAESISGTISAGKKVRVTGIKDLKIYVESVSINELSGYM